VGPTKIVIPKNWTESFASLAFCLKWHKCLNKFKKLRLCTRIFYYYLRVSLSIYNYISFFPFHFLFIFTPTKQL
jgi:dolichyl-phosphate-mannose--protein O-mannosyl transferase